LLRHELHLVAAHRRTWRLRIEGHSLIQSRRRLPGLIWSSCHLTDPAAEARRLLLGSNETAVTEDVPDKLPGGRSSHPRSVVLSLLPDATRAIR
jgi:hypothetical protein